MATDYSSSIFNMLDTVGQRFAQNRAERLAAEQWQSDYARQLGLDELAKEKFAFDKSDADRRYALDLKRAESGAGETWYGSPQWFKAPDGSMRFGVISDQGNFREIAPPGEGAQWAPRVTYQDTGTARVPTFTQGGGVAGDPLTVHGNPEPGTVQLGPNAQGLPTVAPVPGSKAAREAEEAAAKATADQTKARQRLDNVEAQASTVIDEVDNALAMAEEWWATGFPGWVSGNVPWETAAGTLQAHLEAVKANIGFDKLQAMRELSPTGGALGQVSDFENRLLQATQGKLDPTQPAVMKANLARVRQRYLEATAAFRIAYMTDFEGLDRGVADQAIDAIRGGADPTAVMQRISEMGQ